MGTAIASGIVDLACLSISAIVPENWPTAIVFATHVVEMVELSPWTCDECTRYEIP